MALSLLSIVQRAARRMPLSTVPSEVIDSSSPMARQFLELVQEEGDDLLGRHEWNVLDSRWTITTTADPHSEAFPSDYDRLRNKGRFWRSDVNTTPVAGPLNNSQWDLEASLATTFPGFWRRYQTGIQLLGMPVGTTVGTNYIRNTWINNGSTPVSAWLEDSDTCVFPDRLMVLGVRWRWKQSKGLEYGQDFDDHEAMVLKLITDDTSIETINSSPPDDYPGKAAWSGTITPVA